MKSIALIIWLMAPAGHEDVVVKSHYDDMNACECKAKSVAEQYARDGRKTRYLCHAVVEEITDVDENGNALPKR